jgi:uncharacterized protein
MKIAVIGATGQVGTRLVGEALTRGHSVTAIARKTDSPAAHERLVGLIGDATEPKAMAALLRGQDLVVSSVLFRQVGPMNLIDAVRWSGVERYLVVGGAGSLETASGKLHIDSPDFPEFARDEATAGKRFLNELRTVRDLDWTMLCPSAFFFAGERTGQFRLGEDRLLVAADGKSSISFEDYAVALLDEVERPRHSRRRFTVGY